MPSVDGGALYNRHRSPGGRSACQPLPIQTRRKANGHDPEEMTRVVRRLASPREGDGFAGEVAG